MFSPPTRRRVVLGRLRRRLSYGNVMATVAVFIALGGTSYALTLPRNSIGSRELQPHSVGASELRPGAATSRDTRAGAIKLRALTPATRATLRGQQGPPGPRGEAAATYFAAINSGGGVR